MNKIVILVILVLLATVAFTACRGERDLAMEEQLRQTRNLNAEAQAQAGMPRITNFTELKLLNYLYELRDQEGLRTYTYVVDFQGRLWHVCDSIGYGMPFSGQRSNPKAPARVKLEGESGGGDKFVLPQPEPNGLYPPLSSSATWVICADDKGNPSPVYMEPLLTVSPFPLKGAVGSYTREEEKED